MDAVEQIALFQTLFIASAVVAVLGFGFAVFFFFYFNIPRVYSLMTGKARDNTIRMMEEKNAMTGGLRPPTGLTGQTGAISGEMIKHPGHSGRIKHPAQPQVQPQVDTGETAPLAPRAAEETTVLQGQPEQETTVLQAPGGFRFQLTERTIVVHTDEILS